jgi:hypothetical protein
MRRRFRWRAAQPAPPSRPSSGSRLPAGVIRPAYLNLLFRAAYSSGIQRGGGSREGRFIKEGFVLLRFTIQNRYYWFSTGTIHARYSCIRLVNMTLRTAAL